MSAPHRKNWQHSGLQQIERELLRLERLLQRQDLSVIDRLFWQGRRRELKSAAWLLGRWQPPLPPALLTVADSSLPVVAPKAEIVQPQSWERLLGFYADRALENCTDRHLELDILRPDQCQRLLRSVAEQFQATMGELPSIAPERLLALGDSLLTDLWLGSSERFFGRYYILPVDGQEQVSCGEAAPTVMETLRLDREQVLADLQQIPLTTELFQYLLCQQDIYVDNRLQAHGSMPAEAQVRSILSNLLVQLANAVVAPFLNRFGELEPVKQQFYRPQMLATRDLARFRNHLSWQYYLDRHYRQPIAMFESRHQLLIIKDGGIYTQAIYGPRRQELEKLRGLPWLLTIALELRDALVPLAKATSTLVGNVLVYVLTEVVGRGLGLVGKGIIQGLGQALQEKR
jgi:hypothetical protein